MSKRALRRHHRARMVTRAKRIFLNRGDEPEQAEKWASRLANHLAWCSCYSCGNPRRYYGFTMFSIRSEALTLQERAAALRLVEWETGEEDCD